MSDTVLVALGGLIGVVVTAALQYLTAKLSERSKGEKAAGLMQQYLKINEMTGDQLEESINQVWKLTTQNLEMQRRMSEMDAKRVERDDQIEAMETHIAALQEQIGKDSEERQALRRMIDERDTIINEVRTYMRGLLDWFEQKNISDFPIPHDDLLDTHSRIKLKNRKRK